jgi:hypothetical protein
VDQAHEYAFDVKFFSTVKVKGTTVKEARKSLEAMLETAKLTMKNSDNKRVSRGVYVEGDRILMQIDGEDVKDEDRE